MYHDTDRQVHLYHSTQGLPRLGLHPKKIELVFPFLSKERRDNMRPLCLDHTNNLFSFIYIFCTYTKAKGLTTQATTITPPALSGGLQAIKEGTCDANESEATRTWIQRDSASPSVKSAFCLDLSTSSSVFSCGKSDTAATSAKWNP
jgi:hypothetical protein